MRDELRNLRDELRELRNLRDELRRGHEWERVMANGLFRLQAGMTMLDGELQHLHAQVTTSDARIAAALDTARNELRALGHGQVFLAQHVTTERVATATTLQSVGGIYLVS